MKISISFVKGQYSRTWAYDIYITNSNDMFNPTLLRDWGNNKYNGKISTGKLYCITLRHNNYPGFWEFEPGPKGQESWRPQHPFNITKLDL